MSRTPDYSIDVHVDPSDFARALRIDVAEGLSGERKQIPPKWFYDERGSQLFDEITRLPEYYLTRREREILEKRASEIARAARAETLVELGSGMSTKTRLLLDALRDRGSLKRFVPFDVSEPTLRVSAENIARAYPGIAVHAIAGDFERHLEWLPEDGRRLVIFLGSTIGNLEPTERKSFLMDIASGLGPHDAFLLGVDLVKDVARIEAAYNDAAGVTEAFNKNVLVVINRELHADFDPDRFDHVAVFDRDNEWIEMSLRARVAHAVSVADLDLEVEFAPGEMMRTEISAKFRRERVEHELGASGLQIAHWWTDDRADFALLLARAT